MKKDRYMYMYILLLKTKKVLIELYTWKKYMYSFWGKF